MPKLNANLTMLFTEVEFLDRFGKAAAAGFRAVEFLFPYAFPAEQIAEQLQRHNLQLVLHNLPAGDFAAGERGIALDPQRKGEFQDGVGKAIRYAKALGCPRLNCLVGLRPQGVAESVQRTTLEENLHFAARALHDEGLKLLVEPLNSQDVPGFYLVHTQDTLDLFEAIGHPNLYLQYDIYHMQIMEGNLLRTIERHLKKIEHLQLADNPGRHEPGTGEIHYPNLFQLIDELGYRGWIGCEYVPRNGTEDGLGWAKPYL